MVAFMDTTATIPTGAMAERWKWKAFVGWGLFCGALYYPIFGGWTWGGGWLSQLGNNLDLGFGYVDFAGSGVVHAMGGIAGLAGAIVLGARIGKYGPDGKPRTLAAHNIPMAMLGTFILLFGWFGFNAASTLRGDRPPLRRRRGEHRDRGGVRCDRSAMFYCMKRMGKPDPGMMANGMLAGLVAITAPCAFVQPWAAAVIGSIAAVIVVESVFFFERKGIDDPVGAISVHGVGGIFGVLCIGIFADGRYGAGWNLTDTATTEGPRRHRHPVRQREALRQRLVRQARLRPARVAGDRCARDHLRDGRHRLRVLQDPERDHEGRHPLGARPTRSPGSTVRRWACSPTTTSRSARSTSSAWTRRRTSCWRRRASRPIRPPGDSTRRPGGRAQPAPPPGAATEPAGTLSEAACPPVPRASMPSHDGNHRVRVPKCNDPSLRGPEPRSRRPEGRDKGGDVKINTGDTAWVLTAGGAGHVHDARAGAVLRRHGAREERARHAHAELRSASAS